MWFAKWFGGASRVEEEDEPARHSAPVVVRPPPAPAVSHTARGGASNKPKGAKKGFDPYNSGAFERRNAWERVQRR